MIRRLGSRIETISSHQSTLQIEIWLMLSIKINKVNQASLFID